jgi:hypothetical protein
MFQALKRFVKAQPEGLDAFLTLKYAVYDWTRLGLFTSSQVAKYAQTCLKAGE